MPRRDIFRRVGSGVGEGEEPQYANCSLGEDNLPLASKIAQEGKIHTKSSQTQEGCVCVLAEEKLSASH